MRVSDAELLERWRNGDTAAGQELYGRYYYPIERFFLNKVSIEVDDLVQDTFLGCLKNRDRVIDPNRFRAYLFSIAYNVLRTHLRNHYRRGEYINCEDFSIMDLGPGPSSLLAHRREQELLLHGLRTIPIESQVILELHYWERLTTQEIADVLDIPVGTARGRLRRARQQLEEAMKKLAAAPELIATTISNLDDWAEACRRFLVAAELDDSDAPDPDNDEKANKVQLLKQPGR